MAWECYADKASLCVINSFSLYFQNFYGKWQHSKLKKDRKERQRFPKVLNQVMEIHLTDIVST